MAQKNKVKELVGRGLNSYHTKTLQQMDRIEKKNKEQNHKISILSNELDNDYLTKTEEGSVISLEHSKEGMVYLDELQGNTLVNYCSDGSKEMTLNGDINVEGTFVTTTEGVDNGLVDVVCEGNTLINIISQSTLHKQADYYKYYQVNSLIKPNTDYTIITPSVNGVKYRISNKITSAYVTSWFKGNIVFNSGDNSEIRVLYRFIDDENNFDTESILPSICDEIILLEGDWTDKEIPPYFEGMKSVGQDDENGHKVEILSQNKNLFNYEEYYKYFPSTKTSDKTILSHKGDLKGGNHNYGFLSPMKVNFKPNTTYTLCVFNLSDSGQVLQCEGCLSSKNAELSLTVPIGEIGYKVFATDSTNYKKGISFKINTSANGENAKYKIMLVEGNIRPNDYIHYNQDKKEISLNEPLRGVNNVKDKFVKIGGKWFIERNCIGVQFKDLKYTAVNIYLKDEFPDVIGFRLMGTGVNSPIMCDKYAYTNDRIINFGQLLTNEEYINVYNSGKEFFITIKKAKLETLDIEGLMNYFSNNSLEIVGKADSTTYEPITDATLTTYLDTTHISNNSTIPCNMVVKNSGYNAIIKPSTQYTVALDINKSGTIDINLGGAKVTTTNNVATITTPSTLTDDTLRLTGKGIKASRVRLLEGDKTNWIPSYFEGMKSSFEDKLQDDGTYKMEILSHTKKLQNQLLDPNLKTHSFQRTTIDGDWNIFQWNIGDYYLSSKNVIDGDKFKNGDKIYIKFDVIKLSDAHYTGTIWCGRIGGYNTTIFSGEFYNSLPINQQKTLKTIITHNPPDNDPRTFKIDFGDYGRDIECNFKIKDITVVNLTRLYGKGNEPTVEWCDENIPYYNTNDMHYVDMNKIHFSSIEPLRKWDRFVFKDGKLMIERYSKKVDLGVEWSSKQVLNTGIYRYTLNNVEGIYSMAETICNTITTVTLMDNIDKCLKYFNNGIWYQTYNDFTLEELREYFTNSNTSLIFKLKEPIYEEVPFELQKIILEGYENGTLFFDTNIPPTSTVTYAGETPIVKSVRLNKTEVSSNTDDINDNIIPYLMDMDYRVVMLQLATEEIEGGVSMARLFGGTYEMIKRDILSKRLTREEYGYRLADYYNAGKLTEEQVRELEELR